MWSAANGVPNAFTRVNEYYTFHTGSVHLPKRVPGGRRLHIRAPASPTTRNASVFFLVSYGHVIVLLRS